MKEIINHPPHLLMRSGKGTEIIMVDTIVRIAAISNYSKLFFINHKTLVVAKPLKWFDEKLTCQHFIRIHQTHLINTGFIRQYINGSGGKVQLSNGEWITVSKRKKAFFIKSWANVAA